ncbi:hypothetical protein QV08_09875 [Gallibacterium salpingitidis]|uniref:DUF5718 family protein n=1 Tax=Gallibacterium salpingitidis TaxID=505341 RepID=UPI000805BB52|nr:DUF5718 family protein [Gallibacterium salpingitidis]OBX06437.1 hypothetical protein QV08_09875 [Gallibacterium salpingitidis]WKS99364.1 DUF5718 family protein [Gallibacterium salpingitidis]
MNLTQFIGFGVAGNFAGHLEQAGEAKDFENVVTTEESQPKAIFPFYVPNINNFLATFPLSSTEIKMPQGADNLQIEPEVAVLFNIEYDQNKQVTALRPFAFAAYNDCSIRKPNAKKICEKKNWGVSSKGISANQLAVNSLEKGGELDHYRIACYHKRQQILTAYGIDSPIAGYNYFNQKLIDWIIDRMNHQTDQGPMNNIAELLQQANYPTQAVISIGATRYTEFGETNYLQVDDTSIVVVYDGRKYNEEQIKQFAAQETFPADISALVQKVIA